MRSRYHLPREYHIGTLVQVEDPCVSCHPRVYALICQGIVNYYGHSETVNITE